MAAPRRTNIRSFASDTSTNTNTNTNTSNTRDPNNFTRTSNPVLRTLLILAVLIVGGNLFWSINVGIGASSSTSSIISDNPLCSVLPPPIANISSSSSSISSGNVTFQSITSPKKNHNAPLMVSLPSDGIKKYAYAFYATTTAHTCSVFVNIAAIQELGTNAPNIDFVIVHLEKAISNHPHFERQAQEMNVTLKQVEGLNTFQGANAYYRDVMTKLRIFQLYEENYDRIIYMDADMMVRRNLDHLFALPEHSHFAAPRVYFDQGSSRSAAESVPRFCSCFMVFSPTKDTWNRLMGYYGADGHVRQKRLYDMDLLNQEFKHEVTMLPGMYELLTCHWEDVNGTDNNWWTDKDSKIRRSLGFGSKIPNSTEVFQSAYIFHFTPNKPYSERSLAQVHKVRPGAYPEYFSIFERWYNIASEVCFPWQQYKPSNDYQDIFFLGTGKHANSSRFHYSKANVVEQVKNRGAAKRKISIQEREEARLQEINAEIETKQKRMTPKHQKHGDA